MTEIVLLVHDDADPKKAAVRQPNEMLTRSAGRLLGAAWFKSSLLYCSPLTLGALDAAIEGAGLQPMSLKVCQVPDLAKVSHGGQETTPKEPHRAWFWRRTRTGKCHDRCCARVKNFLANLHKQTEQSRARSILICAPALTARCLVARWFHLTPEQFDTIADPHNCDIIRIGLHPRLKDTRFAFEGWSVTGLRFRDDLNAVAVNAVNAVNAASTDASV